VLRRHDACDRRRSRAALDVIPAQYQVIVASPIETCKLHSVNPQAYLTDVLTKLVNN
jgi:hypothetical protein